MTPLTSFQEKHLVRVWAVPLYPTAGTGLESKSTNMAEQSRYASLERFIRLQGAVPPYVMDEGDAALRIVFEICQFQL